MGLFDDMDDFGNDDGFGSGNGFGNNSGFGSQSDGFGEASGDSFGDDIDFGNNSGFGSQSDSFGDDIDFGNDSDLFDNTNDEGTNFSGAFEDGFQEQEQVGNTSLKKQAIITAAVGVVGILVVIFIATRISSCTKQDSNNTTKQTITQSTDRNGQDVNNIMSSNKSERPTSNNQNNNKKDDSWTSIDKSQNVTFNEDYQELIFTVTGIQHLAKKVDINGNLVVKTQLTGGISGLTGNYTLDIPYSKGVKLVVGDSFTVNVQLGTYSGKTVVGEIVY